MKLLHLADLHLGKSVLETSMLPVQREVLTQAADYAVRERAGGILLAGDIYDRSVPPVEAVELLDGFLERLEREGIPVLAIPGNHDSPERLHFGSRIFSRRGIHIAGGFSGVVETVSLSDRHGEVRVHLLPFLRPSMLRRAGLEAADTHQSVAAVLGSLPGGPADCAMSCWPTSSSPPAAGCRRPAIRKPRRWAAATGWIRRYSTGSTMWH